MGKILKLKNIVVILALMSTLILSNFIGTQVVSQPVPEVVKLPSGVFQKFGPRIDKLTFKVAGSVSAEALMLENCEIDVMDWSAPGGEWDEWLYERPEITMGDYKELSVIYIAPNLARWPIGHGDMCPHEWDWSKFHGGLAGYRGTHRLDYWPTALGGAADTFYIDYECPRCFDARQFRRGLSHLVNRPAIVAGIEGVTPIETLILPPIADTWENESVVGMYPYSRELARQEFELGGFKDWDDDNVMEYSPDHGGAVVEELPSLQFYIRQDDPDRITAATLFFQEMSLMGIPHDALITTNVECSYHAWQTYDYDFYTEYWDWGVPLPDIYYEAFHSDKDWYPDPWADNSVRYHSKEFDAVAKQFKSALTAAEALNPCKQMQWIIARDAAVFPWYDYVGYMAHKTSYGSFPGEGAYAGKNWTGIANQVGMGFVGPEMWTFQNVHPEYAMIEGEQVPVERGIDGMCTLRHGLVNDVVDFNLLRTWWWYDLQVLLQVYEWLLRADPYNASNYVPWLCDDYKVGTWQKGAKTCSVVNITLIPGILWQDNVPMTAKDVKFSFEYAKEQRAVGYYASVMDFEEAIIHKNAIPWNPKYKKPQDIVEIRYGIQSWLVMSYVAGLPIIPKHIWEGKTVATWDPAEEDAVIGTGAFRFYKDRVVGRVHRVPGQYVYLVSNPTYFRKLVRPDFVSEPEEIGQPPPLEPDGTPDIWDLTTAIGMFGGFYPYWIDPAYGPAADVNEDLKVDIDDLMEIAVRFEQTGYVQGYPSHYAWPTGEIIPTPPP